MTQKLKQAIALIESAMADIKQSKIADENMANNMILGHLKSSIECIQMGITKEPWSRYGLPLATESTKVNSVTKSSFLDWYFSQSYYDSFSYEIINALYEQDGICTINIKELFDCCVYIPASICVNANDNDKYEPNEVELING